MNRSFATELFYDEPAGAFTEGHVFLAAPDLTNAVDDPRNGYWHCNIMKDDRLTWSEKVYELFGLPVGAPVEREWAVARYSKHSKEALERLRNFGLNRRFGFILDAEIRPKGASQRWIRVLAVPIVAAGEVVGLHGLKREL